jgi:uncharacterized membrane protein
MLSVNKKLSTAMTHMTVPVQSNRIAAIEWMRGFVMIIMVLDHVSMAYNSDHLAERLLLQTLLLVRG